MYCKKCGHKTEFKPPVPLPPNAGIVVAMRSHADAEKWAWYCPNCYDVYCGECCFPEWQALKAKEGLSGTALAAKLERGGPMDYFDEQATCPTCKAEVLSTVPKEMTITCECENCGKTYSYQTNILGKNEEERKNKIKERIRDKSFDAKECPHCGYLQSWMIGSGRVLVAGFVLLLMIPLWITAELVRNFNALTASTTDIVICWWAPVVALIIAVMGALIYRPNRKFGIIKRVNKPRVTLV